MELFERVRDELQVAVEGSALSMRTVERDHREFERVVVSVSGVDYERDYLFLPKLLESGCYVADPSFFCEDHDSFAVAVVFFGFRVLAVDVVRLQFPEEQVLRFCRVPRFL